MRLSRFLSAIVVVFLALASSSFLFSQTITGSISGDVTDSSGAVVADATITAQSIGTGETRTAATTSSGSYRISDLAIGKYKVTATAQGFKSVVRTAEVATGGHASVSPLQVGTRDGGSGRRSSAGDLSPNNGNYVDREKVKGVPLNGRDFNSLLAMTPGVQRDRGAGSGSQYQWCAHHLNNYLLTGFITMIGTTATPPSTRPVFWEFQRLRFLPTPSRN
jgi:hypothetical protein